MISSSAPAVLQLRRISKAFGAQQALDHVDIDLYRGSVHGLLGENGSGKSTFIKILSGLYAPDSGELTLSGQPIQLPLTSERVASLGFRFVHQDLGVIPTLSAAENFFLGDLASGTSGAVVSMSKLVRVSDTVLRSFGIELDVTAAVSELQPVERALLSIVRAMASLRRWEDEAATGSFSGLLVLDEPTVFLPRKDIERVFSLIRSLAAAGCTVLLVSHDLDEILEVTDTVSVLRDGKLVASVSTSQLHRNDLVQMIVGQNVESTPNHSNIARGHKPVLEVRGLAGGKVSSLDFQLNRGEILGLTGLAGAGYDEVPYLLYGARRADQGKMKYGESGEWISAASLEPYRSLSEGIGLLPSDRRHLAGIGGLSLEENMSMLLLRNARTWHGLDTTGLRSTTQGLIEQFDVRPKNPEHGFGTMSGGNQQKALLAKWLSVTPQILMIDEPTQGVDIGARLQIFDLLRHASNEGTSIICASTDHEQLALLTNRTLVFYDGRVVAELTGSELTKQHISETCMTAGHQ